MTPAQLKSSILQLAIQGKLVPQIPAEGTGEELYQQIQKEKQALIKSGKIKKEKPLPPIAEDEIPFDIPEGWRWCRLGELIILLSGTDFKPEEYNDKHRGIPYITGASSLSQSKVIVNRWTETPRVIAEKNDLLIVCKGAGYGKTVVCNIERAHIARQIMSIRFNILLNMYYIMYYINANIDFIKSKGQGIIPGIDRETILNMLFPLPPLAEQRRIVAKIEELMPLIDRYDKAWTQLEAIQKKFPGDLKKSILQMAIQGKLVPQIPAEGTGEALYQQIQKEKQALIKAGKLKKEKPLPPIDEDELPFEIPENWRWVRLGEITTKITDGTHKTPSYTSNGIKFISAKDISNNELLFNKCKYISHEEHKLLFSRCNPEKGDLILSKSGSIGSVAINNADFEFSMFESLALIKFNQNLLHNQYIKHAINYFSLFLTNKQIKGVAVKHLPIEAIVKIILPLPPLAEQKRIVAKIEELLNITDRLNRR